MNQDGSVGEHGSRDLGDRAADDDDPGGSVRMGTLSTGSGGGSRRMSAAVFVTVVAVLLVAIAAFAASDRWGGDDVAGTTVAGAGAPGSTAPGSTSPGGPSSATAPPTTVDLPAGPVAEPGRARHLYETACADGLASSVGPPWEHRDLVEVSGLAVDANGVSWVMNDSGDRPRVYGLHGDGSVQVVDVTGADAVDWEDIALQRTGEGEFLWIADTGANISPRPTVQVYRAPVPAIGAPSVDALRFDVTLPEGSRDVEALLVDPSGVVVLITKEPGTPTVYLVDPTEGPTVTAERAGTFSVGDGVNTVVTSADIADDGTVVVLRTYGSVFLVPVDGDRPLVESLADRDRHCRGIAPVELQGEAVTFLPSGDGYATIGEGANPYETTVSAPS